MDKDGGNGRERLTVYQCECGTKKQWRIGFVLCEIEFKLVIEDVGHFIEGASVIEASRSRNGHVFPVPHVCEMKDGSNKPDPEHKSYENITNCPEWRHEW